MGDNADYYIEQQEEEAWFTQTCEDAAHYQLQEIVIARVSIFVAHCLCSTSSNHEGLFEK